MSIQQNPNDGLWRWLCTQCEPRYEQWGPWGRPTSEHVEAMREAELQHLRDWHTPQILKDAWGHLSSPAGVSNPGDSEPM